MTLLIVMLVVRMIIQQHKYNNISNYNGSDHDKNDNKSNDIDGCSNCINTNTYIDTNSDNST